jgi:hypothetical protein
MTSKDFLREESYAGIRRVKKKARLPASSLNHWMRAI